MNFIQVGSDLMLFGLFFVFPFLWSFAYARMIFYRSDSLLTDSISNTLDSFFQPFDLSDNTVRMSGGGVGG